MAGAYDRYDPLSGTFTPADLQLTNAAAAAAAAATSASSYTKTIDLPLVKYKKYRFQASYLYLDEKTNSQVEGDKSPWLETTFDIPNNTKPVINLVLNQGIKSYGVKFDFQAGSEHEDVIVYESLTGAFAGEQYIVYVGTSNSMTINTSDFANRWVKVVTRDRWLDTNISSATAGPVKPLNADPDTSTAPSAPSYAQVVGSIDANDKSGFSGKITASWTANTDTNTSGYVIRWTTQNPATTQNPIWEYGQVEGKATTTFSVTGLLPNTLYYYQVTAKSPYNALSWASPQSGTFGPIVDSTAPADAYAQLKSIISIGGKTTDLFKIGTGIAQSINTSTTSTPDLVSGTYNGIILNKSTTNYGHNYWLNTGQFRVGSSSAFLFWDGSDLYTTGKINATGGVFSGDVGITNGSIYAGSSPTSGARVRMNTGGFFAYDTNGVQTISISTADGKIDARKGYVGGWTIDGTAQTTGSIYSSNTKLESNGNLTLGDTSGTLASIVRLSANDSAYRLWVGSQTAANAPFRVTKEGKLYASGAVFGTGTTVDGYATSGQLTTVSTTATNAASTAATASTNATNAYNKAVAAQTDATAAAVKAQQAQDSADLKVAAADVASAINNNTTKIEGAKIVTGSIELSTLKVVGNTTNGLFIDNNGIRGYSGGANTFNLNTSGGLALTGTVYSTSGQIGGFDLSNADLTANTSKLPRIIFGNKILIGYDGGPYTLNAGNPRTGDTTSFYVNTNTNVFRFAADSSARDYAAEIRNTVRARSFRYIVESVLDSSSRRFKENIVEVPKHYYERVLHVKPSFYTYINNHPETQPEVWGTHGFGPIVEDLEDAGLGLFVERNLNGEPTSLRNPQNISFLLIPVVRDLKAKVDMLEAKLLELEGNNV